MTSDHPDVTPDEESGLTRHETFEVDGPIDIDLLIGAGRITVALVEDSTVSVDVRPDAAARHPWTQGISSLLKWVNGQFGETPSDDLAASAVRETRIQLRGRRLVVQAPKRHLGLVPLAVTVHAPAGSNMEAHSGAANVTTTGPAGRVTVFTGSGDVAVERADAVATVTSGSGVLRLGPMLGGLRARSGTGRIEVSSVGGSTTLVTGSGDVWLGAVSSDVTARTGSGNLNVAEAARGNLELTTGSGEIRVGVRAGTLALVDLASGSGQARSELNVFDTPPTDTVPLRVRGRTGSGDAVVAAAGT